MSALVTEHFVLQSAASTTVSEASGRAALYLATLSSSLIAMGFIAQSPGMLLPFAATVIPAVLLMGLFTIVRLVETGVQNLVLLAGIARIRRYYRTIDASAAEYFMPWGHVVGDQVGEALAAMSTKRSRLVGFGTTASMVAVINSVLAGAGVALLTVTLAGQGQTTIAVTVGILAAILSMVWFYQYQNRAYRTLDKKASTTELPT